MFDSHSVYPWTSAHGPGEQFSGASEVSPGVGTGARSDW
jgi:hypothetical protein